MGNGCIKQGAVEVKSPTLPTFKVVVVGDSGSGKTSIVKRFVDNKFDVEYKQTKDVDITSVVKKVNVPQHAIVSLELWDIPGLNDVDLRKTYYLDVDAVVVVTDISNNASLNLAGSWSLDIANHARVSRTFTETVPNPDGKTYSKKTRREYVKPKPGTVPVLLLGNKYDLAKENFLKEMEEGEIRGAPIPPLPDVIPNGVVPNRPNEEKVADSDNTKDLKSDSAVIKENEIEPSPKIAPETASQQNQNGDSANHAITEKTENDESAKMNDEVSENGKSQTQSPEERNDQNNDNPGIKVEGESNLDDKGDTDDLKPGEEGNGEVTQNGIGNGDLKKTITENGDAPPKYKKIFPKDEKMGKVTSHTDLQKMAATPSPEDAKSSVTYATSVASLLPPCVEEIERIVEKCDFIAGVPVSAKTVNGGVQEAIQSLLRHLVAKKLFNLDVKETMMGRKKVNFEEASIRSVRSGASKMSRKSRKKIRVNFEPLQEVGIIEIDEVIRRCNPTLHDAEELTTGYEEALHGFKMACFRNKLTSSTRVSLEVCVTALKQGLTTPDLSTPVDPRENIRLMLLNPEKQTEQKLSLIVEEKDGFPDLRIVDGNRDDVEKYEADPGADKNRPQIPPKISKILQEYREKFLPKSIEVSKHGGEVESVLGKRTMELAAKEEKAWETAVAAGLSHGEVRRILSTLAQDKARLRGTVEHVRDTRKAVQTAAGKIRAALLF